MTEEPMVVVVCDCGFRLGIRTHDIPEIAAGVWGTIPCPQCRKRMNDKIKELKPISPSLAKKEGA